MELELNKTQVLELLFDDPMVGNSKYGEYYLYAVKNGSNTEYSFFAPAEVNEQIKALRKGDRFEITKLSEKQGTKIITKFDVKVLENKPPASNPPVQPNKDNYFEAMLSSYQDALKIQEQLNGMVDVNRIAITLFIARSKISSNGYN